MMTFLCQLVIAWMLAGVMGHVSQVSVTGGIITAAFLWLGFIATTLIVNHRFQGAPWSLTLIDGAHWLGVQHAKVLCAAEKVGEHRVWEEFGDKRTHRRHASGRRPDARGPA